MDDPLFTLTLVTAVGSGTMGGALFAFSAFVMHGLRRLPPAEGIAAMQSINITAITPAFMTALFGTGAACVALAIAALSAWEDSSPYLLAGSALYLAGVILLTLTYHVPRNDRLAKLEPGSPEAASYWARYLAEWTGFNHVRSAAGLGAAALLMVAVQVG